MYYTFKIRIKMNEKSKKLLSEYEQIYHDQISLLVTYMTETGQVTYKGLRFMPQIANTNHWLLYQTALKAYRAKRTHKTYQNHKSSSWQKGSFTYCDGMLLLKFGGGFEISEIILPLSLMNNEEKKLTGRNILRADLVHDEKFWFVNFLLSINECNDIKS